jgi:EAL domain-containing protein (putative c-di-GMP-specific phosphodiesterase class I)
MHTLDSPKPDTLVSTLALRAGASAQNDSDRSPGDADEMSPLEQRVVDGLRAGEFHLAFQGAYRAADSTLVRLEAQLRWTHPDYGLLLPGMFMMPLEHPDVAHEMALFVVDNVCRELRDCLASGLPVLPVALTIPAHVAILESFADRLRRVAHSYGVPTSLIEVDVPDSPEAARLLGLRTLTAALRQAGVSVSLSKWGNGESSLALLGSLDVDTISIARELMSAVPRDPRASAVMSAVLDLLDVLDVRVLVNGVDTDEQLQWLRKWPNALLQGLVFPRSQAGLASVFAQKQQACSC